MLEENRGKLDSLVIVLRPGYTDMKSNALFVIIRVTHLNGHLALWDSMHKNSFLL